MVLIFFTIASIIFLVGLVNHVKAGYSPGVANTLQLCGLTASCATFSVKEVSPCSSAVILRNVWWTFGQKELIQSSLSLTSCDSVY